MGLRLFSPTWALDGGWVLGNNDEKKNDIGFSKNHYIRWHAFNKKAII